MYCSIYSCTANLDPSRTAAPPAQTSVLPPSTTLPLPGKDLLPSSAQAPGFFVLIPPVPRPSTLAVQPASAMHNRLLRQRNQSTLLRCPCPPSSLVAPLPPVSAPPFAISPPPLPHDPDCGCIPSSAHRLHRSIRLNLGSSRVPRQRTHWYASPSLLSPPPLLEAGAASPLEACLLPPVWLPRALPSIPPAPPSPPVYPLPPFLSSPLTLVESNSPSAIPPRPSLKVPDPPSNRGTSSRPPPSPFSLSPPSTDSPLLPPP